ncbi:hypothetical protein GCM10022409_17830 [Hymenobacter glaciei]|uniref:Carboxypeptidase-like regulatory domain-containing protein n=1 Tax=Hymenobacter glaciei TaxID=877209 RepID=A0ABP7U0G5_9BACT
MKDPLPKIALLFLLLLPLLGRAQEIWISGRVVDAKTKQPIPFASLGLLNTGAAALTNENGYFQLVGLGEFKQDSLILMTLGYCRQALFVEQGKAENLRIEMKPRPPGYIISCPVGPCATNVKRKPMPKNEVLEGLPGTQYAFLIDNKANISSKLQAVSFYAGENGLPGKLFRLRIYDVADTNSAPARDLLTDVTQPVWSKCSAWL